MAYELFAEAGTWQHVYLGYFVVVLVVLRILWGLIGSRHARFSDFVKSPGTVIGYLVSTLRNRPRHYLGHNPAGGWMVIALLVGVAATGISGWAMKTDALWGEDWVEELHEGLANGMLVLIALHLAGVVVASFQHKENLVRAMITGQKPYPGTPNHD